MCRGPTCDKLDAVVHLGKARLLFCRLCALFSAGRVLGFFAASVLAARRAVCRFLLLGLLELRLRSTLFFLRRLAGRGRALPAALMAAAAAPTAGLHFTPELRAQMASEGVEWAEVTLHVGYGTFSPVRCEDIREHVMHEEFVEVPQATVDAIGKAKAEGRPVIAVGTTSARTLEGVAGAHGGELTAHQGWINCFIWPGYRFHVLDGLITNFHLPESTLLMLVSALTGRERMLETYTEAVKMEYRFFSYGDAMLIR